MGEDMRIMTTEYGNVDIDLETSDVKPMEIPQYAIDIMAEYYLKRMQDDYMKEKS
jgi:hypothetical protein